MERHREYWWNMKYGSNRYNDEPPMEKENTAKWEKNRMGLPNTPGEISLECVHCVTVMMSSKVDRQVSLHLDGKVYIESTPKLQTSKLRLTQFWRTLQGCSWLFNGFCTWDLYVVTFPHLLRGRHLALSLPVLSLKAQGCLRNTQTLHITVKAIAIW